jgi:hypothetical protein
VYLGDELLPGLLHGGHVQVLGDLSVLGLDGLDLLALASLLLVDKRDDWSDAG